MWRILTGQHTQIQYLMQVPGHARCLIDGGFGMIKKLYRRSDCDSIESLVNNSSSTNCAVRYPAWCWRSWKHFLSQYFKPLKGIRKFQQFLFSDTEPGVVCAKESQSGDVTRYNIMKVTNQGISAERPPMIEASGLSPARQAYLHNIVCPYVRPVHQHDTCPSPQ